MKSLSRVIFALLIGTVLAAGLAGCHTYVEEVDTHGYHHRGYYDERHDWHGGYYDEDHHFHDDPHDWHHD